METWRDYRRGRIDGLEYSGGKIDYSGGEDRREGRGVGKLGRGVVKGGVVKGINL